MSKSKTSSEVKNRWNEKNYDRITIMAKKGKKDEWKKIAAERGFKGLNGYIIDCIENSEKSKNVIFYENRKTNTTIRER